VLAQRILSLPSGMSFPSCVFITLRPLSVFWTKLESGRVYTVRLVVSNDDDGASSSGRALGNLQAKRSSTLRLLGGGEVGSFSLLLKGKWTPPLARLL
jgi:hypothetical protein